MNQNIIIIAGMHRSGTSLSGNLLEKSGLYIGEALMSHGFDNRKGHFEDMEILEIHEKDLNLKKLDTRGLKGPIKGNLNFEPSTVKAIDKFLLKRKDKHLWGWKEPRTTLYLQNWKLKLPTAKCIAIFRDFDTVERSLIKRYQHKLKHGVAMTPIVRIKHALLYPVNILIKKREAYKAWCVYNENILAFKRQYPDDVVIVELNHFLNKYNEIITEINKKFTLSLRKIDVEEIFEKSMLNIKTEKQIKIRVFSKKKLVVILTKLKEQALWI